MGITDVCFLAVTATALKLVLWGGERGSIFILGLFLLRIHQLACPTVRKILPKDASETVLGQIRVRNLFSKNGNKWISKVKQECGKEIKYFLPNIYTAFKHFQQSGFPELDVVCLISNPPFPPSNESLLQMFVQTPLEFVQTFCRHHMLWQGAAQVYMTWHMKNWIFFVLMHWSRNIMQKDSISVFPLPTFFPAVKAKREFSAT